MNFGAAANPSGPYQSRQRPAAGSPGRKGIIRAAAISARLKAGMQYCSVLISENAKVASDVGTWMFPAEYATAARIAVPPQKTARSRRVASRPFVLRTRPPNTTRLRRRNAQNPPATASTAAAASTKSATPSTGVANASIPRTFE